MKTKAHVRFLNRITHYGADLELADLLSIATKAGRLSSPGCPHLFDSVDSTRHKRLTKRVNNQHNRLIAISHLKATLYASFIKDIYEDMVAYLQAMLYLAAENGLDPGRLIGDHKTEFTANSILEAGGWEQTVRLVTKSVFRSLENEKDTKKLIIKIDKKLNLDIDEIKIETALPYLELRHLLVHSDGVADEGFCKRFTTFGAQIGKEIRLDYDLVQKAESTIAALVREFDEKIVTKKIVNEKYMQK